MSILMGLLLLFALGDSPLQGSPAEGSSLTGDVATGRKLFVDKGCIRCHAVLAVGGNLGPDLGRSSQGRTFYELVGLLWGHSPKMTETMAAEGIPWPTFKSQEMADIMAYLYFLNYFDEPGDYLRGEKTFTAKSCSHCHRVGESGGEIGPPLDLYARSASSIRLAQAMWNHGPAMSARMGKENVLRPHLEGQDIADLLCYLRGAGMAAADGPREYSVPGDPNRGRKVFEAKGCKSCHETGRPPSSGAKQGAGPSLAKTTVQRSVTAVAATLWNHAPVMWEKMQDLKIAVPTLEAPEMADLIAYLYFIHFFDEPGDPKVGEEIFRSKGCVGCHGIAKAQSIGPDLVSSIAVDSAPALAAALWNHAPRMLEKTREVVVAWPTFRGTEMRDLVAYLESLSKKH